MVKLSIHTKYIRLVFPILLAIRNFPIKLAIFENFPLVPLCYFAKNGDLCHFVKYFDEGLTSGMSLIVITSLGNSCQSLKFLCQYTVFKMAKQLNAKKCENPLN